MARPAYLLDLDVLAELTRPTGNRRVFTLFQQRQASCALAAPIITMLVRGIDGVQTGARRDRLQAFARELLASGLPVLPFDREAALWLAQVAPEQARHGRAWRHGEGQVAAIAATRELVLVGRGAAPHPALRGLLFEDWFRP